jgi:hypothetical protein
MQHGKTISGRFGIKMIRLVECSEFVKRQTPESGYSHFDGSWDELADVAASYFNTGLAKQGYKEGVMLITVPVKDGFQKPLLSRFYSATVTIKEETKLKVAYAPRQRGEDPFIRVSAKAKKQPAAACEIILYHKDVLAEDDDRSTAAEWEVIAIKARASTEEEPMDPYTMARNFLHMKGGTKGDFTAEQFAQSIVYWNNHCMTTGKPKWYRRLMEWIRDAVSNVGMHAWNNPPK